jgi:hypothetical protein
VIRHGVHALTLTLAWFVGALWIGCVTIAPGLVEPVAALAAVLVVLISAGGLHESPIETAGALTESRGVSALAPT